MAAVLADADACCFLLELLLFGSKNFDYQGRDKKVEPFNEHPPPADATPPQTAMMFVYKLCLLYSLYIHILAPTFRTYHLNHSLSFVFGNRISVPLFYQMPTQKEIDKIDENLFLFLCNLPIDK